VSSGYQRPPFRYRRLGGGYRREDVDEAFAELRLTLRQLDVDLADLDGRNRNLEDELSSVRGELDALRAKERELTELIAGALRRASDIEEAADRRGAEIVAQAKEEAMRIRAEATRRIEESGGQFNELFRVKDRLLDAMRRVVADFDHAILGERADPPSPAAPAEAPPEPQPAVWLAPVPEPRSLPDEEQVFETRVELDAGPFAEFAELSAFERSLVHLPEVEDAHVRRLADQRALIELTLSERAPLLQAMRESLPYSLEVRSADRSRLVVDVEL
jgi:F0F1-type ATP synthase membrane subunit b/b'